MTDYRQHPEYLALLEAVRMSPEDDAPRWVIADWIEEAGDEERAGFIREQLQVSMQVARCGCREASVEAIEPGEVGQLCVFCEWAALEGFPTNLIPQFGHRRGFISEIRLAGELFLQQAEALFGLFPITRVIIVGAVFGDRQARIAHWDLGRELTDRLPAAITDRSQWGGYNRSMTTEKALELVSAACVRFGRDVAGLPAMPAR